MKSYGNSYKFQCQTTFCSVTKDQHCFFRHEDQKVLLDMVSFGLLAKMNLRTNRRLKFSSIDTTASVKLLAELSRWHSQILKDPNSSLGLILEHNDHK